MNKYILKELYTQTYFSRIYKYKENIIKRVPKKYTEYYRNDYDILKNINDPNIIKIKEIYEDSSYFYTVMKYYPYGDLYYNISNNRINTTDYKKIVNKLINPISIIHKENIVHMDLKLENYLLNEDDNYILFDFNLAKIHKSDYYDLSKINRISGISGTTNYIAPEIYNGDYCKSSDMYSLGSILYLIYTREYYNNMEKSEELLNKLPDNLKYLIIDLLNDDYKLRPSVYDINNYLT